MPETDILVTRETKRSFGLVRGGLAVLMLGLPFLGRQRIRVTNERVIIEQGFWTKLRDDVEVFRIRDVVSKQAIWHRMLGIGDVVIKATEGRADEEHVLRGVPDPVGVSEAIRAAWNASARPRGSTNLD
ncbi:PH domain-containing protein [Roseomonas frigidaquae]|uniref:PH domain-containing protein n=1 Tax=Falsiroseomonas frigidaquae TaxID=487318 RepID=A0ABX1F3K9_9PROT|nr:PH domain-containing protein [Falsiroseomonas frigidaquae]NKE46913.1 PH domain-containing protein [Falsiroseomonas frigidaquae]